MNTSQFTAVRHRLDQSRPYVTIRLRPFDVNNYADSYVVMTDEVAAVGQSQCQRSSHGSHLAIGYTVNPDGNVTLRDVSIGHLFCFPAMTFQISH